MTETSQYAPRPLDMRTWEWSKSSQKDHISWGHVMSLVCGQRSLLQSRWRIGVGDVDVQKSVWQQTLKEVETGALVGPISLDEVDATFPLSRRFGLQQGQKVRRVMISPDQE